MAGRGEEWNSSTSTFRLAAIPEEGLKGFLAGLLV